MKKLLMLVLFLAGCSSQSRGVLMKNCHLLENGLYLCYDVPAKEASESGGSIRPR